MIPINVDITASKNTYSDGVLHVTSFFYTLQGEGLFAGHPFIFVRFAGCNFGTKTSVCTQCDTSFQLKNAMKLLPATLFERVWKLAKDCNCYNLVITGGEPTLQYNVNLFMHYWRLYFPDSIIQIETNGTIPSFYDAPFWGTENARKNPVYVCCSPKCNEVTKQYVKIPYAVQQHVSFYKYLLSADENSCYHTLPDFAFEATTKPLYVSPITVYRRAPAKGKPTSIWGNSPIHKIKTAENYAYAAKYVLDNVNKHPDIRLSLQTHLFTSIY